MLFIRVTGKEEFFSKSCSAEYDVRCFVQVTGFCSGTEKGNYWKKKFPAKVDGENTQEIFLLPATVIPFGLCCVAHLYVRGCIQLLTHRRSTKLQSSLRLPLLGGDMILGGWLPIKDHPFLEE
jgi:hypothetical protein